MTWTYGNHKFGKVAGRSDADVNDLGVLYVLGLIIAAGAIPLYQYSKKKGFLCLTQLIVLWYWVDACTHLILEHAYVILALFGPTAFPATYFLDAWREYGTVDRRWSFEFGVEVVTLEVLTVYVVGPLCLVLIYGITVCVCELYGGWLTFGPEWLSGSPNLVTTVAWKVWIYLFVANFVWVVIPVGLLYQSFVALKQALGKKTKVAKVPKLKLAAPPSPKAKGRAAASPRSPRKKRV